MKAVVLCAGLGTRLGDVTKHIPKPMLPLHGKPLLQYTLDYLRASGIREIAINVHYFPEQIMACFGDGAQAGVRIHYSYEEELLGTAGALSKLYPWLAGEEDFLVLYGDILTDQDLQDLIDRQHREKAFATLLLHRRKRSNSIVTLDRENRIVDFRERPSEQERQDLLQEHDDVWVNSGIQVLSRNALAYITKTRAFDLPRDVYSRVFAHERIFGQPLTGFRVAIDSEDRYQQAQTALKDGSCRVFPPYELTIA